MRPGSAMDMRICLFALVTVLGLVGLRWHAEHLDARFALRLLPAILRFVTFSVSTTSSSASELPLWRIAWPARWFVSAWQGVGGCGPQDRLPDFSPESTFLPWD